MCQTTLPAAKADCPAIGLPQAKACCYSTLLLLQPAATSACCYSNLLLLRPAASSEKPIP